MEHDTGFVATLGIDLSDKKFDYVLIGADRALVMSGSLPLTQSGLSRLLKRLEGPTRVALEVGTHSPWVSRILAESGHEVLVANPRRLPSISRSSRKNDRNDAEQLARLGRSDPQLLSPIQHRGERAQSDLAQVRSRAALVKARSGLINHVRGTVKSWGARLKGCSSSAFHYKVQDQIPSELVTDVGPILDVIETLTVEIRSFDKAIEQQCETNYQETQLLRQVTGVGSLTALTFVLVLEDHRRFNSSRSVGAFLGLTPRQDDSGETRKQLRITKEGDHLLRKLLVGSANYILGPFGPECSLRSWGDQLMLRGGKNAKKRATVAVARKLSVLLHSLWKTGEVYDPLRHFDESSSPAA